MESEEKAKEELKKKRSTGGSNENDSTTNQKGESDSFRQSEKSKSVTAVTDNSVGEEQPQQSEIELDEGEIKSTGDERNMNCWMVPGYLLPVDDIK